MAGIPSVNKPELASSSAIANGKKVTKPRQRTEKKKIQDRLAQRAAREKTKQRIASLEQALNSLRSDNDSTNTNSLLQLVANLRDNNSQLRSALNKIQNAISLVALIPEDEAPDHNIERKPWACNSPGNKHSSVCSTDSITPLELVRTDWTQCNSGESGLGDSDTTAMPTSPHTAMGIHFNVEEESSGHDVLENSAAQDDDYDDSGGKKFDFDQQNILELVDQTGLASWNVFRSPLFHELRPGMLDVGGGIVSDRQKWFVGNTAYFGALDSVKRRVQSATTMDFQVAFQAALWGWKNVGQEAEHPVWNALRMVDQRIFGSWTSKAQRIAMMYICQTLIQYREDPTTANLSRVPDFLQPRPAQERLDHPVVVDFLVWPGMRDRLVFEHEKYSASGAFSAAYVDNFHFFWPFPDEEIFRYDPLQDQFEFAPVFLEYVYNYKNWTMKARFFENCPEMKYDVPIFEESTATTEPGLGCDTIF